MNIRKKKGFTLVELMISVAIIGIVSAGVMTLMKDGITMWRYGTARMALTAEARTSMVALKKMIQQAQGATIKISRFNSNSPANSYLSAVVAESVFITTTQQRCGCGTTSDVVTVGGTGAPVEFYQYNNFIRTVYPQVRPGTDLTDNTAVQANTYYVTLTITSNVESLMFTFVDSKKGTAVSAALRLSKKVLDNKPPVTLFLKETVIVKRMHSAGYYYN
jgi:prepilin-type N-terminal cleavage/methylation domain-containing protein